MFNSHQWCMIFLQNLSSNLNVSHTMFQTNMDYQPSTSFTNPRKSSISDGAGLSTFYFIHKFLQNSISDRPGLSTNREFNEVSSNIHRIIIIPRTITLTLKIVRMFFGGKSFSNLLINEYSDENGLKFVSLTCMMKYGRNTVTMKSLLHGPFTIVVMHDLRSLSCTEPQ